MDHLKTDYKENWRSSPTEGKLESSLIVKDEEMTRYTPWKPAHFSFRYRQIIKTSMCWFIPLAFFKFLYNLHKTVEVKTTFDIIAHKTFSMHQVEK